MPISFVWDLHGSTPTDMLSWVQHPGCNPPPVVSPGFVYLGLYYAPVAAFGCGLYLIAALRVLDSNLSPAIPRSRFLIADNSMKRYIPYLQSTTCLLLYTRVGTTLTHTTNPH